MRDLLSDPRRRLLWLLLLALAVRGVVAAGEQVIKKDSCGYLTFAHALGAGDLTIIHHRDQPPLYPLLIALTHLVVTDWVVAGALITVLLSALAVLPLHRLGETLLDRRSADIAGLLFALHPLLVGWGARIVSDGPYLTVWLTAIWFAVRARRDARWADFALCGMASGAAYLIRPEGLAVLLLLALYVLPARGRWRRRLGGLMLAGVLALLVAGPYLALVSWTEGMPVLTKKKKAFWYPSLTFREPTPIPELGPHPSAELAEQVLWQQFLSQALAAKAIPADGRRVPTPGGMMIGKDSTSYPPWPGNEGLIKELAIQQHPLLTALALIAAWLGLMAWRRGTRPSAGALMLLAAASLHMSLIGYNYQKYSYFSERHLMPAIGIGLLFAALGLGWVGDRLAARYGARRWLPGGALATLLALVLLPLAIESLKPRGHRKLELRLIGEALAAREPGSLIGIIGDEPRIAWYAGPVAWYELDVWNGWHGVLRQLVRTQARYVIVDHDHLFKLRPFITLGWLRPVVLPEVQMPVGEQVHIFAVDGVPAEAQ